MTTWSSRSVVEYTTLSTRCQCAANSASPASPSAQDGSVSQPCISSYIRRPCRNVPISAVSALTAASTSGSGNAKPKSPASSATKPSREQIAE